MFLLNFRLENSLFIIALFIIKKDATVSSEDEDTFLFKYFVTWFVVV